MVSAVVTDERLNTAFASGFEEARAVLDETKWMIEVTFRFEDKVTNVRTYVYGEEGLRQAWSDASLHLANGPGTSTDIRIILDPEADVIDAEVVEAEPASITAGD